MLCKASKIFCVNIATLSSIIGSDTGTIFDRVSDEFLVQNLSVNHYLMVLSLLLVTLTIKGAVN